MKTAKTRTSPRTKSDKQKANKIRHFLRCRTTRTSPDKSILSGGHLTGQDKVSSIRGPVCPSVLQRGTSYFKKARPSRASRQGPASILTTGYYTH